MPQSGSLKKTSVFIDVDQHQWLRAVRAAALVDRDDVSSSALIRLSLGQLQRKYPDWAAIKRVLPQPDRIAGKAGRPRR